MTTTQDKAIRVLRDHGIVFRGSTYSHVRLVHLRQHGVRRVEVRFGDVDADPGYLDVFVDGVYECRAVRLGSAS